MLPPLPARVWAQPDQGQPPPVQAQAEPLPAQAQAQPQLQPVQVQAEPQQVQQRAQALPARVQGQPQAPPAQAHAQPQPEQAQALKAPHLTRGMLPRITAYFVEQMQSLPNLTLEEATSSFKRTDNDKTAQEKHFKAAWAAAYEQVYKEKLSKSKRGGARANMDGAR